MLTRIIFFVLCLFSVATSASPKIQTWVTDNGVEVYFVEAHEIPMVDLQIVFDAGSSRDGEKAGLAILANSLLNEGAAGMDVDEISRNFENLGAVYGNDTGYDSSSVSLRSLVDPEILNPALENLKRVIQQPDFPADALERLRNQLLIGIRSKQQSPGSLAKDAFFESVYGEHPYAEPTEGTEQTVQQITRDDVVAHHKKYYVAANAMVAMVGDLGREQAEKLVDKLTRDLPVGEEVSKLPEVDSLSEAKNINIDHPSSQTHVLVGQPGVMRNDPDYFTLYVGNHVLGGGGMVSRLFSEVREKRGLSYSAYSYFSPMKQLGPFAAGLQTKNDQSQQALTVLNEQIEEYIKNGPTEQELEASKKNITGGYALRIDSNREILGYLAVIGFYGLPLDYLETFNSKVESITIEDIKDAFKRRLSPEKFVTVTVGPNTSNTETKTKTN